MSDLDQLLDSALEDFDKYKPKPEDGPKGGAEAAGAEQDEAQQRALEALTKLAQSQGEGDSASGDKSLADILKELLAAAEGDAGAETTGASAEASARSPEDAATIKSTLLEQLQESARTSADAQPSEAELSSMMEAMMAEMMQGLQGGAGAGTWWWEHCSHRTETGDSAGLMDSVMEGLLSKEVLYPSLMEVSKKYPSWLDENAGKVEVAQLQKYRRQHACILEILAVYESHGADTPTEPVLALMEKEFGPPPKELLQGMPGDSKLLESMGDCCVM